MELQFVSFIKRMLFFYKQDLSAGNSWVRRPDRAAYSSGHIRWLRSTCEMQFPIGLINTLTRIGCMVSEIAYAEVNLS